MIFNSIFNSIFNTIINMSLTGGVVIAAVMVVRLFLWRAPKIFSYLLWGVVLLRLLCPVSFTSVLSVFQVADVPVTEQGAMQYLPQENGQTGIGNGVSVTQTVQSAGVPGREVLREETARPSWDFGTACSIVWMMGVAVLWIYSAVSVIRLRRKLVGAVLDENSSAQNIYLCDYIGTAFVMGVVRPRIYLPTILTEAERSYILLHEKTHIRRGDHIFRLLAFLALSLHWFNPLVWCAFFLSERDMEMSCDETVMRRMGTDLRAAYSASLLNLASGKRVFAGAPLGFGEGNVKCRIRNIMRYKRMAVLVAVPVLALVVIVSVALGSNPAENHSAGEDSFDDSDGAERVRVTQAVVTDATALSVDGPSLDYADENTLIFHDYFGLFVYDTNHSELIGAVDLNAIGCQYTQGDAYCEVSVAKDGQKVYLHPMNIEDMYVYDVVGKILTRQRYDLKDVELFGNLMLTEDCLGPEPTVWRSRNCVPLGADRYLFLEDAIGTVEGLHYIVEQNHEQIQFARIFDEGMEQQASLFGYMDYTGYLDMCRNWDGYEQFNGQDYDGDGSMDRVYRTNSASDDLCTYRIEFGNGDILETGQLGTGIPEILTCDLNGDGVKEVLLQLQYGFSTDPSAYGEIALFEKKNGGYEPLMPPEELCTDMEGSNIYNPSVTVICKNPGKEFPESASMPEDVYRDVSTPHIHLAVKELAGVAAIDEMIFLNSDLEMDFGNIDTEQEHKSVSYKAEIVNNGKNDLIEFHFEALNKWSLDEIVVTAVYENGVLRVAGSRYVRETGLSGRITTGNAYDISPVDAAVFPEVELPVYEEAVQRAVREGKVQEYDREFGGTLPGSDEGVWYSVLLDGVEYLYGKYDYDEEGIPILFSWALRDDSRGLANGLKVGMTKDEVLKLCPNMLEIGFGSEGYPAWNRAAYPEHWTDEFDSILVANIEDYLENPPFFLALMMKNGTVAAITTYEPTAG